ncbi:hypothetical protein QUF74_13035 [Candidatus Halobeggiatoa sp. HSG11]|nr:hypothetical protein [Candidatus Halobeggiatoa sp. HSG11]
MNNKDTGETSSVQWNNLFFGSFQLLYWIFFKPSAWRDYCGKNDVHCDFCLTELNFSDWKKYGLGSIFIQGYIILPILSVFIIGGILFFLESIRETTIINYDINLWYVIAGSFGFSLAGSIAFGTVNSAIVGVASSVLFAIVGGVFFYQTELNYTSLIVWCLMVGIISNIIITLYIEREIALTNDSLSRSGLFSKIFIGFFIGLIGVIGLVGIPFLIIGLTETPIAIAVLTLLSMIAVFLCCIKKDYKTLIAVGIVIIIYILFTFTKQGFSGGLAKGIVYGIFVGACISIPYLFITRKINKDDKILIAYSVFSSTLAISFIWGFLSGLLFGIDTESTNLISDIVPFVIAGFVASLLGLSFSWWRGIVLFPFISIWHTLIYLIDKKNLNSNKPSLLHYHAAFWDELQWIKQTGLVEHILLVMERNPKEAKKALQFLQNNRHQKWAIDVSLLKKCTEIDDITDLYKNFEAITRDGNRFKNISKELNEACQQFTIYNQILALTNVENSINSLILREIEQNNFKVVAETWYQIVSQHKESLHKEIKELKQIDNPYIFASPLSSTQTNFVGRTDIINELQDLLFKQHASVFLQGIYRIGKTSLLMNLKKLLNEPDKVVALLVDLQGAASIGNNVKEFFYQIAEEMKQAAKRHYDLTLPTLSLTKLDDRPYKDFDKWLDKVQEILGSKTLLLMFDEFAKLDEVIRENKSDYSKDILDAMRHWMQHRENFQIVITSQRMEEFNRWPSLANNMILIYLGDLTEIETRQLIEHPVKDFELKYDSSAVQRILELTCCHPALVQLLCREIVVLKNKQDVKLRFSVTQQDIEEAISSALETGQSIFITFEQRATDKGNALLHDIAVLGSGKVVTKEQLSQQDDLDKTLNILQSLELLEQVDNGYRFRIEMFRLWYIKGTKL